MKKRVILAWLVFGLLVGSFAVVLATSAALPSGDACAREYTVQGGDTLAKIANHFRISLADLIQLNRDRVDHPDRIYVGQKLCVAIDKGTIPLASDATDQVLAVEITYTFELTDTEHGWNLTTRGGELGRRSAYTLQKLDPIRTVSSTREMIAALVKEPGPLLLVVQNGNTPYSSTYTLIAIDGRALMELLPSVEATPRPDLSPLSQYPRQLCLEPRTLASLGGPSIKDARAKVVLEEGSNTRPLLDITNMDIFFDRATAQKCYTSVLADQIEYALLPGTEEGSYQVIVRDRPPGGQLVVDVEYRLTEAAAKVAGSEFVGRRIVYPIQATEFFSTPEMLLEAYQTMPSPVLLTYRNNDTAMSYTLATIGDARLLKAISLREVLTPTQGGQGPIVPPEGSGCAPLSVAQLGATSAEAVTLTVLLENRDGVLYPFPVSHVVSRTTITKTRACFGDDGEGSMSYLVGLLAAPVTDKENAYRAVVQLQGTEIGPTGALQAARCRYWPRRGRFNRWLRGWFGCR